MLSEENHAPSKPLKIRVTGSGNAYFTFGVLLQKTKSKTMPFDPSGGTNLVRL